MSQTPEPTEEDCPPPLPAHDARVLTGGGVCARIVLDGTAYTLRITRGGKLILTK
ncbi:hemin uptake protein HemP [Rhodovulum marinum]|uniref:Hemin uptake protein HemP n=1 Tax=Rhodovulum marinum TaxID=320662 RepID=A0A4R2Q7X7_9RHOB|nr:hemin uptake protein HemP [Rhodovulum marinum]TCP42901.1 hemin uptake protein HemP [Rhodovulum marinum]